MAQRALPPDKCCSTDLKVAKFSYEWTITNLIFRCSTADKCDVVESPEFSCSEADTLRWRLKLCVPAKQSEMVTVELDLLNFDHDAVLRNKFSLLGLHREILLNTNWSKPKRVSMQSAHGSAAGLQLGRVFQYSHTQYTSTAGATVSSVSLMEKSKLLTKTGGFLPDEKLTIFCEINVHNISSAPGTMLPTEPPTPAPEVLNCDLGQQLGSLLETATLSDVTLAAGNEKFKAHKAILSARSPVFRAMFKHDGFKEQQENFVRITDHDPKVVKEMLTFIYTGEAPELKEKAHDLFCIADKYQLERLKQLCEKQLWTDISVKNVVDTLLLAMTHDLIRLKRRCTRFIANHIAEVMKTKEWKKLKSINVELADMFVTITDSAPPTTKSDIAPMNVVSVFMLNTMYNNRMAH